jgi:hypothetical protein
LTVLLAFSEVKRAHRHPSHDEVTIPNSLLMIIKGDDIIAGAGRCGCNSDVSVAVVSAWTQLPEAISAGILDGLGQGMWWARS